MFQDGILPHIEGEPPKKGRIGRMLPKAPLGTNEHRNHVKNSRTLFWKEIAAYPRDGTRDEKIRKRLLLRRDHGEAESNLHWLQLKIKNLRNAIKKTTSDTDKRRTYEAQLREAENSVEAFRQAVLRTNDLMDTADQKEHRF